MNHKKLYIKLFFLFTFCGMLSFFSFSKSSDAKQKNSNILQAKIQKTPSVNRWNFKIKVQSDCIFTYKEVKASTLALKNKSLSLSAGFQTISDDGKHLTYMMDQTSTDKLLKKGSAVNGSFQISSSLFTNKGKLSYKYRNSGNTLCGFIFNTKHKPVSKAAILVTSSKSEKIISTKSNKNGYYELSIPSSDYKNLTIKSPYFRTTKIKNVSLSSSTPICENFILHTKNTEDSQSPLLAFELKNQRGEFISQASIQILNKTTMETHTFTTSDDGTCFLSSENMTTQFLPATVITNNGIMSYQSSYTVPAITASISPDYINFDDQYLITINKPFSKDCPFDTYESETFSCCFSYFPTDTIFFSLILSDAAVCPMNSLQIDCSPLSHSNETIRSCLKIYQDCQKKPIYEVYDFFTLNYHESLLSLSQLKNASAISSFHFPKGTYYLAFSVYEPIQQTSYSIDPITIYQSTAEAFPSMSPLKLHQNISKNILAYENCTSLSSYPLGSYLQFDLYQVINNHLLYQDTISTSFFLLSENSEYINCSISLTNLLPNATYYLLPIQNKFSNTTFFSIQPKESVAIAPFSLNVTTKVTQEKQWLTQLEKQYSLTSYCSSLSNTNAICSITLNSIRTSSILPYVIIQYLDSDGNFISSQFLSYDDWRNNAKNILITRQSKKTKLHFALSYINHAGRMIYSI